MADEITIKGEHGFPDEVFTVERLECLLEGAEIYNDGRLAGYHGPNMGVFESTVSLGEDRSLFVRSLHKRWWYHFEGCKKRGFFGLDITLSQAVKSIFSYPYMSVLSIVYSDSIEETSFTNTAYFEKSTRHNSKKLYEVMKKLYEQQQSAQEQSGQK